MHHTPLSARRAAAQRHTLRRSPVSLAILLALPLVAQAQAQAPATASTDSNAALDTVTVSASADASAEGLTKPFAGGQVSRGGRLGIFGNQDVMDTPFNTTSYTNELIQNQQSRSVGDVLLNDPSIRVARGFGNFQEAYFVRGFLLSSDSVAYNGLYGLLPRQYISAELFERVELIRGASAFLNGASPSGDAIGGSLNLLPKRAPNEALNRLTAGFASGGQSFLTADVARRFGPDSSTGVRLNAGRREGGTGVHNEKVELTSASLGLDWRSANTRLSADLAHQDHQLSRTRTNVTPRGVTSVPGAPNSRSNWAQPWSFSNERDTYGTLRGEYDINQQVTVYGAYGHREAYESNSLANLTLTNADTGAGSTYRFDNTANEKVDTGEVGVRAKLRTGSIGHSLVAMYSAFKLERRNAYGYSPFGALATNLYSPIGYAQPGLTFRANNLADPTMLSRTTKLNSFAIGDTLSLLDDALLLTLGIRHQRLEYASYRYNTGLLDTEYKASHNSPLVAAVYKLDKQVSLYANYVESLSQGDSAPAAATNAGTALPPFVSKQKEIGVKFDGGRFGSTAALFSTAKPRSQYGGADTPFLAGGEDLHQGLELTVYGEAMRGLRVLGGITLLKTEQRSTGSASTDGRRTVGVPSAQGTFGVEWDVPGARGLVLDTRLLATRGSYIDPANTAKAPGWGRLDLGARYMTDVGGKLVTVRARLDNVLNRNYWSSVGGYPGNGYLVLGTPRTFSLSASIDL